MRIHVQYVISLLLTTALLSILEAAPQIYTLEVNGTELSGTATAILKEEIARSQFILYGEDHGFADSAIVLRAIAKSAQPAGFKHLVVEVGPLSTAILSDALKQGGVPAIAEIVHRYPLAVPFLSLKDDAEFASDFLGQDAKGNPYLWGVDQEFMGSSALHLERLVKIAKDDAARQAAQTILNEERDAVAKGAMDRLLLGRATATDFDSMAQKFKGVSEAEKIISELKESAAIYQLWMGNHNYENNTRRAKLLTENFLKHYRAAADSKAKVIFKMGIEHTALGTTTVNTIDIGTLATEIARANDMQALRICFLPMGGQNTSFAPKPGNPTTIQKYEDPDTKKFFSEIGLDAASISTTGWTLVPLEPIRKTLDTKGIGALSPMSRMILIGFDYLITTPDAKPGKFLY
jgi:hypothetical protein